MKKIESKSGGLKRKVRDRMRSIGKRVLAIALSTRLLGPPGEERRKRQYRELLSLTRKVMNQAQRVLQEVQEAPRRRRAPLEDLAQSLETMIGRVRQGVKQTRHRDFGGAPKLFQHQRWFRKGQKWRTGSEGRISVLKRRHGLRRCLYPGLNGMRRWVGLGVIADNFIQMGCYLARQST